MKMEKGKHKVSRGGFAIVIALFFCFVLMLVFFSVMAQHRTVSHQTRLSLQQQQAFFAARAGLQHLLLKARLFPTELYDAVEFSQGKNPLFDFSEHSATLNGQPAFKQNTNPKFDLSLWVRIKPTEELDSQKNPKYFYLNFDDRPELFVRIGNYYTPEFRFLDSNIHVTAPTSKKYTMPDITKLPNYASIRPQKFLDYFIRDCTNGKARNLSNNTLTGPILQTGLIMDKSPSVKSIKDYDIRANNPLRSYPYSMNYVIEEIKIGSLKELRRYNEEAIEIKVTGIITDFQGKKHSQIQTRTQKITRRGAI
jgi:hypothetical protein